MAGHLSDQEVRQLARLARLELTDDEIASYAEQLTEVIHYNLELLERLEAGDVVPTSQTTGLVNAWRDDEPRPSLTSEEALSQAPNKLNGYFSVPQVLDEQ